MIKIVEGGEMEEAALRHQVSVAKIQAESSLVIQASLFVRSALAASSVRAPASARTVAGSSLSLKRFSVLLVCVHAYMHADVHMGLGNHG